MARWPLGGPVNVPLVVRNPTTQALVNDASLSLVVKIANADGTSSTTGTYASPTNDSTGNYHQLVPAADLTVAGHYQWTATATGAGAGVTFGEFDVFDSSLEVSVLPLADAKDALNIAQTIITSDNEILQYVETIQGCLERMTGGPLVNKAVSERAEIQGAYTVLLVRQRPLVSVTSIVSVASGQAIDISAGLDLDANASTIRRKLGYPFYGPYFTWLPAMTVNYVAGWGTSVPAAFGTAGRIILQHLWKTQHGPSVRPGMAIEDTTTIPGFGFAIPQAAAELLEGSQAGVPFMTEAFI